MLLAFREPKRGRFDDPAAQAANGGGKSASIVRTLLMMFKSPSILHAMAAHTLATGVQL